MIQVSALVLTKNSEKTLRQCLESLANFHEILVFDSGSSDGTESLAKSFANVVFVRDSNWQGFGVQRQKALNFCTHEWIFWLDSDEALTSELREEVEKLDLTNSQVAFRIKRRNFLGQKEIRGTDWGSDWVIRLFSKKLNQVSDALVHEKVEPGSAVRINKLNGKILHYPYQNISDFYLKINRYTDLALAQRDKNEKPTGYIRAWSRGLWTFFRNFVIRLGFADGFEGFVISYMNGFATVYKYLRISEQNRMRRLPHEA